MAPITVIDSHIHLWPKGSDENSHAWMTPGMPLATEHLLAKYFQASEQEPLDSAKAEVSGVVYVETDRRYEAPSGNLRDWAQGPLDEIKFLRSIVEGQYGEQDSKKLLGIVAWAPMDQPNDVLQEWLTLAKETAGDETWKRIKGFRFLLQAIHDQQKFQELVIGKDFIQNLKTLGKHGLSFDVGVDQHSGGVWQLELVYQAMQLAHTNVPEQEKVIFVLNHLCKPDFSNPTTPGHEDINYYQWTQAVEKMSNCTNTYMKLSGAFSELPSRPSAGDDAAAQISPWVQHVLKCFGPKRVIFGSDWPVCNLGGPSGESPWVSWTKIVQKLLDNLVKAEYHEYIWSRTAAEAYRLASDASHTASTPVRSSI